MIPPRLSEDLCSLHPHVDRLAFSALFTMDERANLLSTTFAKSVIRSAGALSYADAQERLEREGCPEPRTAALQTLGRLAVLLKGRRAASGALFLGVWQRVFTPSGCEQEGGQRRALPRLVRGHSLDTP